MEVNKKGLIIVSFLIFSNFSLLSAQEVDLDIIDSIDVWDSTRLDSITLLKKYKNIKEKKFLFLKDSIKIFFYRNIKQDSVRLKIGDEVIYNKEVVFSQFFYKPELLGIVPKTFLKGKCIELFLYKESKKYNVCLPDIKKGKSIILKPILILEEDKYCKSYMEIQTTDFDYNYFLQEIK